MKKIGKSLPEDDQISWQERLRHSPRFDGGGSGRMGRARAPFSKPVIIQPDWVGDGLLASVFRWQPHDLHEHDVRDMGEKELVFLVLCEFSAARNNEPHSARPPLGIMGPRCVPEPEPSTSFFEISNPLATLTPQMSPSLLLPLSPPLPRYSSLPYRPPLVVPPSKTQC